MRPTSRFLPALLLAGFYVACSSPAPSSDSGTTTDASRDVAADATTSASALIGPDGGSLAAGGIVLTVPSGALAAPQTLTVTRTNDAAPAGLVAYSPIYRFAPEGLVFARPVSVSIDFSGDATRAGVYWTNPASSDFTRVATTVSGSVASALVAHFSEGFVGSQINPDDVADVDATDDGVTDVPATDSMDASVSDVADGSLLDVLSSDTTDVQPSDASDTPEPSDGSDSGVDDVGSDASTGSSCGPSPVDVDPATFVWGAGPYAYTRLPTGTMLGCGLCSDTPEVLNISLTAPAQVTMWASHSLSPSVPLTYGMATDCRASSACLTSGSYPSILTSALPAGVYQIATCTSGASAAALAIEALSTGPAPVNTNCAGAVSIDTPYSEPRVLDALPRMYRFTLASSGRSLVASSPMNTGQLAASVRSSCSDPATEVASGSLPFVLGGTGLTLVDTTRLAPGTYYAVVSGISEGLLYTIGVH